MPTVNEKSNLLGFQPQLPPEERISRGNLIRGSSGVLSNIQIIPDENEGFVDGKMTPRLMLCIIVVSLGSSLQFGYGTGVMNNSEQFIRDSFTDSGKEYNLHMWAATVSMFGWGGLVGAFGGTKIIMPKYGRKWTLQLTSFLVFISSAFMAFGPQWWYLCIGRFFIGVVAGVATGVVPTYLSEISPIRLRGGIGTAHQLGITLGILFAQLLSTPSLHLLGSEKLWPWLFAPPASLAFLQLLLLPFCPESPSFLYVTKGEAAAKEAIEELQGNEPEDKPVVDAALNLIKEEVALQNKEDTSSDYSVTDLLNDRSLRKQLVVGVVVQLMMQLSGIDAVFYYSTDVFKLAGVRDPQLATTLLGIINVLVTIWAVKYMDIAGRRTLLLASWSGMLTSYVILTTSLVKVTGETTTNLVLWENVSVMAMTGVIIFFAFGPGCIAWLIIAEIFPLHARESAMSVGMSINWVANWAVAFSFPILLSAAKEWAFLVFICTTGTFLFFTLRFVPETKNRTIPEITRIFTKMPMSWVGAVDD